MLEAEWVCEQDVKDRLPAWCVGVCIDGRTAAKQYLIAVSVYVCGGWGEL